MGRKYDVFGIGTALVDYFVRCDDGFLKRAGLIKGATNFIPRERLDELHAELSGSIFACFPGDNARNVCEGVCFLGGKSAYASRIGEDEEGKIFEDGLRAHSIGSFLEKRPGHTGKIMAFITPDFQRTFAADLGNSTEYDSLPADGIKDSKFLYITSITLLKEGRISESARNAIELAGENGVRIAISLENPPMVKAHKEDLRRIISGSDVLFANEEELEAFVDSKSEEAARRIAGDKIVFLKKGGGGSVVLSGGERFVIPAYPARVVDTTGAGDFYAAGAIFGLNRGQSAEEAGRTGAKLAAKVVENFGATLNK